MNLNQVNAPTINLSNAGLAAGTTSTYTTTATTVCVINGAFATGLTAQTNTASPTTDARTGAAFTALGDNQVTCLVWGVNAAGAIRVCQGTVQDTATGVTTTAGTVHTAPQFPELPADFCPIGYSVHKTAPSASAWTPCTGEWAATGVTSTFTNCAALPARPVIA